jgi:hypothetical protein
MNFAIKVVWPDGDEELLKDSLGKTARFSKSEAEEQKEFMLMGMSDEVQSISVVKYRRGDDRP